MEKSIVLLLPALLLLGCTGCGICMPAECPMFAPPPPAYYEQCSEKGGHITADKDPITCCVGPPYCADEDGNRISITISLPTPTIQPTTNYSGERESRCVESGGTWLGGSDWFACDCGSDMVYNTTTYECERCPEGQLVGKGLGPAFCYTPTGFAGLPCDRKTDCGGGYCFLVNENAAVGKGVCSDLPFGCHQQIDENGEIQPMLCVD